MNTLGLLQLLGTAPLFASRAFLAAFLVALTARFGHALPFLADSSALQSLQAAPPWFTSDVALVGLGILAVLEAAGERSIDTRRILAEVGPYLKLAAALAINLGLADAQSAALLQHLTVAEAPKVLHAGLDSAHVLAGAAALVTFWLAVLRKRALGFLMDADDEDALGLQGAIVWVEDAFVFGGVAALALFPMLALLLLGASAAVLVVLEGRATRLEAAVRVPCAACGADLHPSAPSCPACATARAASDVGAFGRPRSAPARPDHAQRLLAARRCSHCATRLRGRALDQRCAGCGRPAFGAEADVRAYVAAVQRQLPKTLLVCAAFGAVPLLGLVPGIIYYRLSLLGGLARYLPPGSAMATRWLARGLTIALLAFQWVPGVGAAMLPLLCLANYALYRRALLGAAGSALGSPRAAAG